MPGKGPAPPAAAPPSAPSLSSTLNARGAQSNVPLRARLAVISDSPETGGYVGKPRIRGYYEVTADPNQVLRVEYTPSGSGLPVEFRLLDSVPERDFDRLGMVWHVAVPKVAAGSAHNALCVAVQGTYSESMLSCHYGSHTHSGPVGTTIWSLSQDGSVNPVWGTGDHDYYTLQTVVLCQSTKRLLFVADFDKFTKTGRRSSYDKARLVLEPIQSHRAFPPSHLWGAVYTRFNFTIG